MPKILKCCKTCSFACNSFTNETEPTGCRAADEELGIGVYGMEESFDSWFTWIEHCAEIAGSVTLTPADIAKLKKKIYGDPNKINL